MDNRGKSLLMTAWVINLLPAVIGIAMALSINILWLSLMLISGLMLRKGFIVIPPKPPYIAVVTFWKKRLNVTLKEGLKLLADYPPVYIGAILVNVEKKNTDFSFPNIRCRLKDEGKKKQKDGEQARSGGEVSADVSFTWIPDKSRINEYIDSGEENGVKQILHDMIAEDLRQIGEKKTWEEITFAKDKLSATLITKLTGKKIWRIEKDDLGKLVVKENKGEEITIDDPEKAKPEEISFFLKKALDDGASDIHDLGIKIRRLNVMRVEPHGELAKDAEFAAREIQQRRRQDEEQLTRIEGAKQMIKAARKSGDKELTFAQALEILRIEEGKTTEIVVRSSGNPLLDAAALFQGRGKKGGWQ